MHRLAKLSSARTENRLIIFVNSPTNKKICSRLKIVVAFSIAAFVGGTISFNDQQFILEFSNPNCQKPNKVIARKIIHAIAAGTRVVEIPGYKNLSEFSKDWTPEIQLKLEEWQRVDGFLKFAWIQGLSGNYHADPKIIAAALNFSITQAEQAGQIHWTMWQLPGITAHASLMIGGEIDSGEYLVDHIDSNRPNSIRILKWASPSRSVDGYMGKFVPYVARKADLATFKSAGDQYCSSRNSNQELIYEPLSNHAD